MRDALELRARIVRGETTVESAVAQSFARIDAHDPTLHAFLALDREGAAARARELDRELANGATPGPLFGVPLAVKSNLCVAGRESNCGSRILAGYRAPYTATAVQRARDAGAVIVGATNMDEFAFGSSGENSAFGATRNPWDTTRTPGGSSSGSAAAVAAGLVPLALGSDTGGSVRQPAALCGVSGFKPSYGRVSRYGLIMFGSSLDCIGTLARSVHELEALTSVISGADERDSTCAPLEPLARDPDASDLRGLRVGVPDEYFGDALESGVRTAVERALDEMRELGAELVRVRLPHTSAAVPAYYVIATAEASSNLARYDGVRYGARADGDGTLQGMFAATRGANFGREARRRVLLGTFVLSRGYYDAWYERALKVRRLVARDFADAFEHCDLIAGPTNPTAAFPLGERSGDPVAMYMSDVLSPPINLAGLPGLSIPCGFSAELPVGLQLVGPALADARVLRAGRVYQQHTDHHLRAPSLVEVRT